MSKVVSSDEKSMGHEVHYEISAVLICPNCTQEDILKIDFWEYPQGTLEYIDNKIEKTEEGKFEILEIKEFDEIASSFIEKSFRGDV